MIDTVAPGHAITERHADIPEATDVVDAVHRGVRLAIGVTAVASFTVHVVRAGTGRDFVFGAIPAFDVEGTRNVVAWITSTVFLVAAACCAVAATVSRRRDPALGWWTLGGLHAAFSVTRLTGTALLFAWPVAAVGILAAAALARAWPRAIRSRVAIVMALLPVGAPVLASVGLEGIGLASAERALEWSSAMAAIAAAMQACAEECNGRLLVLPAPVDAGVALRGIATLRVRASGARALGAAAIAIVMAASLISLGCRNVLGPDVERWYRFFYVDFEGNLPTWFSSMLLAACAAVAAAVALAERAGGRPLWPDWTLLAGGLLAMSCDEAASLHELLVSPMRALVDDTRWLRYPLIVPGGVLVIAAVALQNRFLRALPADSRRLLVVAGAVFVIGALGLETVGGWYDPVVHGDSATYVALASAEEACEMAGACQALYAILRHLERHVGPFTLRLSSSARP